jgi:hypothetical protein
MRVRRRPPIYDAVQEGTMWVVTNLSTKEKKIFTQKEFRLQFEAIPEEKKQAPVKRFVDESVVVKPRFVHDVDQVTGAVTLRETFGPWEQR